MKKTVYPSMKAYTNESRATHPALLYRDAFQDNYDFPITDPQATTCIPFHNNLSTRIIEKNNFIPNIPK